MRLEITIIYRFLLHSVRIDGSEKSNKSVAAVNATDTKPMALAAGRIMNKWMWKDSVHLLNLATS